MTTHYTPKVKEMNLSNFQKLTCLLLVLFGYTQLNAQCDPDTTPPIAVCNDFINVSLSSDGTATFLPEFINENSYDACCLEGLEVKRIDSFCEGHESDLEYGPSLTLCCEDAYGGPLFVSLKVSDCSGNFNECWATVLVEDKLPPIITCPEADTTTCGFFSENLAEAFEANDEASIEAVLDQNFGTPTVFDNCNVLVSHEAILDMPGSCGDFTITRNWTAYDGVVAPPQPDPGNGFSLIASNEVGLSGDNICMDISVHDFEDIISMQFSLNFDASVLEFSSIDNTNLPGLNGSSFGTSGTSDGYIALSWIDPLVQGIDLEDGTVIFQICFNIIGSNGQTTDVVFSEMPTSYEVTNSNGNMVEFNGLDATVNIGNSSNPPATCSQVILFEFNNEWSVEFPADITLDCYSNDVMAAGEPVISNSSCGVIATAYEDIVINTVPGSEYCIKILRTWTVLNWCDGTVQQQTQVIKIQDSATPVISCPDELQVFTDPNTDLAIVNLSLPEITDCSINPEVEVATDLPNFNAITMSAVDVPEGTYNVLYTVSDVCENLATCSTSIVVGMGSGDDCPEDMDITCDFYHENLEATLALLDGDAEAQNQFLGQFFGSPGFDNTSNVVSQVDINLDQCGNGTITRTWSLDDNPPPPSDGFTIIAEAATADIGDQVCLDFSVNDFEDILSMQFSIHFDPDILDFDHVQNFNLEYLDNGDFGIAQANQGTINVAWFDNDLSSVTLPDGTVIFQLCFTVVGDESDLSPIWFDGNPVIIEVIDVNGNEIGFNSVPGSVSVNGDPPSGECLVLSASNASGNTGDQVCLDVSVNNFSNLLSFQYSMNFDPTVLQFSGIQGLNLQYLTSGNFGTSDASNGNLTTVWFDNNVSGVTVAENTVIYQVCFDVIGNEGDQSSFIFTGNPTAIEIIDGDENEVCLESNAGSVTAGNVPPSNELAVSISNETANLGDVVCVKVTADNFIDINSLDYSIHYQTSILEFQSFQNINLPNVTVGQELTHSSGTINLDWADADGLTLSDGAILHEICFTVLADQYTTVYFNDLLDPDVEWNDGSVNVEGDPPGDGCLILNASNEMAAPGEQVCVDFTVNNFSNILSMQYSMHFDPGVLQYSSVQPLNLPGLHTSNFGTFNTANGDLTVSWFDQNVSGVDLSENTVVYQVCFDVVGEVGDQSNITFDGSPTAIEVTNGLGELVCFENNASSVTVSDNAPQGIVVNNTVLCTQVITINHVSDFVVEFPADVTIDCATDPTYGEPIITGETCELVAVSWEDQVFTDVPGACYSIERKYTVINWCVVGDDIENEVIEVPESQLNAPWNDLDGDGDSDDRTFRDSWDGISFPSAADAGQDGAPDTDPDNDPWDGYITYTQDITIIDNTPPELALGCTPINACMTNPFSCEGEVSIPQPEINDCSELDINITSDLGEGFGPFSNVALGVYTATLTATDLCGNTTSCSTTINVIDCIPPVAVCDETLTISLTDSDPPSATLFASTLDDGSFDTCSETLLFSFSEDSSDNSISFGCSDLGGTFLQMWITDEDGNQNVCLTQVNVVDNLGVCPDPCANDTGAPVAYCVDGLIIETLNTTPPMVDVWAIDFDAGSFDQCSSVSFSFSSDPNNVQLLYTCADVGEHPIQLWVTDENGNQSYCETSVIVTDGIGSCDTSDDCSNWPNPPLLACNDQVTLNISSDQSTPTLFLSDVLEGGLPEECYDYFNISFSSTESVTSLSFDCDDIGSQVVTIYATDTETGNQNACWGSVQVQDPLGVCDWDPSDCENDPIPPTPYCLNGLVVELFNATPVFVQIWASDFDQGSFDNCTDNLQLSFSPDVSETSMILTCDDLGTQLLQVWVTDDAGNQDFCETFVIVQDNFGLCSMDDDCADDDISPVPFCASGLVIQMPSSGELTLDADVFDIGSIDNCTAEEDLILSIELVDNNGSTIVPPSPSITFDTENIGANNIVLYVTDEAGNVSTCNTIFLLQSNPPKYIHGKIFIDDDENCSYTEGEQGLDTWSVKLELIDDTLATEPGIVLLPNSFEIDEDGNYTISLPDDFEFFTPDSSVVTVNNLNSFLRLSLATTFNYGQECPYNYYINAATNVLDTVQIDFPVQIIDDCPQLSVDISTPFLRRCFDNTYYVHYCNFGNVAVDDAFIEIEFDDFLLVNGATLPWSAVADHVYTFELGTVGAAECGSFEVFVTVDCEAELGQTHCVDARIFPDLICDPEGANYSGADLQITGYCDADSVRFEITNVGDDMDNDVQYIIIEDFIMYNTTPQSFKLNSGETENVSLPNNGSTWRVQSEQIPGHPIGGSPSFTIEGCTQDGTFSTGFVTQFPMYDNSPVISINCMENVGSFDPNDKLAVLTGYGEEHYIEANTELEYLIRFQNTGTDTAFNVVVMDTLSPYLDPLSVRPGTSSHPYDFTILGNDVLKFNFDNIMLPDSNVNEAASHGYVKFRVSQLPDVPLETVIENHAAIYFDFNDPIITNTVFHTIGEHFIEMPNGTDDGPVSEALFKIYPNPFDEKATVEIEGLGSLEGVFKVYDMRGRLMQTYDFEHSKFEIQKEELPSGIYFYQLINKGSLVASGKMAIK